MKQNYHLQVFYYFLVILLIAFSCNAQDKPNKNPVLKVDPYFIESTETFSVHGPDHIVRDLLQDKNGVMWFASWLGIISYDGKIFTNHTLKDGLIRFHIVSVFEDSKGNLWFGTARGGVYLYNGKSFKLFTTADGLADNTVMCFAEDKSANIWMGTEQGISCYKVRPSGEKMFTNYTTLDGLNDNYVSAIIEDKNRIMWFGSNGGLNYFDGKKFSVLLKEGKNFKKIMALHEDKSGKIWIGAFEGLICYDPGEKGEKAFADFLSPFLTYYFAEDREGNILFSHSEPNTIYSNLPKQVLYKYYPGLHREVAFDKILEKGEPNDFQIFGKTVDRSGNIWFGTMHGPCKYDGKNFTYFYINKD